MTHLFRWDNYTRRAEKRDSVFMWSMSNSWTDPKHGSKHGSKHGPQFLYWFFDTTLTPSYVHSLVLVGILIISTGYFAFFERLPWLLATFEQIFVNSDKDENDDNEAGRFLCHLVFAVGVCSLVVRFRD